MAQEPIPFSLRPQTACTTFSSSDEAPCDNPFIESQSHGIIVGFIALFDVIAYNTILHVDATSVRTKCDTLGDAYAASNQTDRASKPASAITAGALTVAERRRRRSEAAKAGWAKRRANAARRNEIEPTPSSQRKSLSRSSPIPSFQSRNRAEAAM